MSDRPDGFRIAGDGRDNLPWQSCPVRGTCDDDRTVVPEVKKLAMRCLLPLTWLLALAACSTISELIDPVSPAEVAALEEGVTIADTLALNYTRLPPCPTEAPVCSVVATKQAIKNYAQQAHDAVKTLQTSSASGAPAALSAAQAALEVLELSIPAASATQPVAN
jgi:hypothetical protein